jgi:moderate conductance mechanosensitive channel
MLDQYLNQLNEGSLSAMNKITPWLLSEGVSVVIVIIIALLAKKFGSQLVGRIIGHTVRQDLFPTKTDREKRIKTLNSLISATLRVVIWIVAGLVIVSIVKPSLATPLFASAGVIGVALGFGARKLIEDFSAGVSIIIENQYRVGDVVALNNIEGTVEAITIRTTVLRDLDGNQHHVPNGSITITTNKTMDFANINEDIAVDHKTDLGLLELSINQIAINMTKNKEIADYILEKPYLLRVKNYGPNGLVVKVLGKTTPSKQWQIRGEFYKQMKIVFEKNKINFPPAMQTIVIAQKK